MHPPLPCQVHQVLHGPGPDCQRRVHPVRPVLCGMSPERQGDPQRRAQRHRAHQAGAGVRQRGALLCGKLPGGHHLHHGKGPEAAGLCRGGGDRHRRRHCEEGVRAHHRRGQAGGHHLHLLPLGEHPGGEVLPRSAALPCHRALSHAGPLPEDQAGAPRCEDRVHRALHLEKSRG